MTGSLLSGQFESTNNIKMTMYLLKASVYNVSTITITYLNILKKYLPIMTVKHTGPLGLNIILFIYV